LSTYFLFGKQQCSCCLRLCFVVALSKNADATDDFISIAFSTVYFFFQFNCADSCGVGTSVEDIIDKYRDQLESCVKRQNPISVPESRDCMGHMSFMGDHLHQDELSCLAISPSQYLESTDTCWLVVFF